MKKINTSYYSVLFFTLTMLSCNNPNKVKDFVNTFYSSLELNDNGTNKSGKNKYVNAAVALEKNPSLREYVNEEEYYKYDGKLIFDDSLFRTLLNANSIYSFCRVNNLTDMDHDQFNIKLIKIDSVLFEDYEEMAAYEQHKKIEAAVVYTEVQYVISGFAKFINKEKVVINIEKEPYVLQKWEDIEVLKIIDRASLNLKQNDLYKRIGSLQIEQIPDSIASMKVFQEQQEKKYREYLRSVGYDLAPEKYYN